MAEQRLIDANALIDWLTKATGFRTNCDDCTDIDCLNCIIEEAIKNAPTIEAKPVVHGRWELEYGTYGKMRCSVCKKEALIEKTIGDVGVITNYVDSNYCPNCGAKMDEKEE